MATKKNTKNNKETIYIDVDDEITAVIDKVKASEGKIVALVLPKRAPVLQSVVNMKLLKKAATSTKKNIVLITSEKGLLPLAGVAGLHVAKSPQSKPAIPPPPVRPGDSDEEPDEVHDDEDPQLDKAASIGVLAAAAAAQDDDTETIELDNMAIDVPAGSAGPSKAAKPKKAKNLKVPNFERFRLLFILGGLALVLLAIGWYFAVVVMPRAMVTITTNTTSAVSSFDFTAATTQEELDTEAKRIPAVQKSLQKTDSEKVNATGKKDLGTKAEGTMTLKNCSNSDDPITISSGTRFSSGEFGFVSTEAVSLPSSSFSGGGSCTTPTRTVDVVAERAGDTYNLSARTYTSGITGVQASGSAMQGGTSRVVTVVSQKDIDDAVSAVRSRQDAQVSDELKAQFDAEELFALAETLRTGEPKVTSTPALDAEATEATISVETSYQMLGIKREDLSQVIKSDVEDDESLRGQAITNDGIDAAIMRLNNQPNENEASISFRTSVTAGPEIDEDFIKESIRGKRRGEAEAFINGQPGVEEAIVDYSPFWVYSTPKAAGKITITIEKVENQSSNNE